MSEIIPFAPTSETLVSSGVLCRTLGISDRTLRRYREKGYLRPKIILPGGWYRWDLAECRARMREYVGDVSMVHPDDIPHLPPWCR